MFQEYDSRGENYFRIEINYFQLNNLYESNKIFYYCTFTVLLGQVTTSAKVNSSNKEGNLVDTHLYL